MIFEECFNHFVETMQVNGVQNKKLINETIFIFE